MRVKSIWLAFAAGLLGAIAAQASEMPFAPGERVSMKITYLAMKVGEVQIAVGHDDEGERELWPIEMQARTRGLFDSLYSAREHFVSHFDPASGRAVGSDESSKTGDDTIVMKVRFPRENAAQVERTVNGRRTDSVKPVPPGAHDVLSAIYHLRSVPLAKDNAVSIPVFTGRKSWTLEGKVVEREKVKTSLGKVEAWRISCRTKFDGQFSSDREIQVWITADERRIPVKIEADFAIGALKATLVDYDPPKAVLTRR